jgi:hypothetical protein
MKSVEYDHEFCTCRSFILLSVAPKSCTVDPQISKSQSHRFEGAMCRELLNKCRRSSLFQHDCLGTQAASAL